MAAPAHDHAEPVNTDKPTQGIFVGYVALGLIVLALLGAALALAAGMHG